MNDSQQQPAEHDLFGRLRSLKGVRLEWPILLIVLIVASAIWGFIELADEVSEGSTDAIDRRLLLLLRDPNDPFKMLGPSWLGELMRDFTSLGGTGVLTFVTLSATGFLVLERKRHAAALLLVSVVGGVILSNVLKLTFARPRPEFSDYEPLIATASFPSAHSMMSAVVYLTIGALIARMRPDLLVRAYVLSLAIFVAVIVGISRIYLGVHWPTDVLAGWVVGSAWALFCWLVALLLQRRGDVENP